MTTHPETSPARQAQHGLAELELARRNGRTRLTRSRTRTPLLVQQTLYPDPALPDMAFVIPANPTPGLLNGDRQEISITVHPGAKAHVTTQSATKIHTMPNGGQAQQLIALNVANDGYLEYLPDPLIPYRNAALDQHIVITLEPEAALLTWEIITPGRTAMGEAYRYRRITTRLTVTRPNRNHPAYHEAYTLTPTAASPAHPATDNASYAPTPTAASLTQLGLLGPAPPPHPPEGTSPSAESQPLPAHPHAGQTLGSMLILCEPDAARNILERLPEPLPTGNGAYAAASLLPDDAGVGIKVIGPDSEAAQATLTRAWTTARQELLGVPPPPPRKY